jgi:hypothetical protein
VVLVVVVVVVVVVILVVVVVVEVCLFVCLFKAQVTIAVTRLAFGCERAYSGPRARCAFAWRPCRRSHGLAVGGAKQRGLSFWWSSAGCSWQLGLWAPWWLRWPLVPFFGVGGPVGLPGWLLLRCRLEGVVSRRFCHLRGLGWAGWTQAGRINFGFVFCGCLRSGCATSCASPWC